MDGQILMKIAILASFDCINSFTKFKLDQKMMFSMLQFYLCAYIKDGESISTYHGFLDLEKCSSPNCFYYSWTSLLFPLRIQT